MENNQDKFKDVIQALKQKLDYGTYERSELPCHDHIPKQIEGGFVLSVITDNIEKLKKTVKKLNGRLNKMNLQEITIEVSNPRLLQYGTKGSGVFYEVKVLGVYPKFENCEFVGKIEHNKEGVQLFVRKEFETRITREECEKPFCDYCKTNRDRKSTFLIEKDGEVFKVGKSCMSNFVGRSSLESIMFNLSYISELENGFGYPSGFTIPVDPAISILTNAFAVLDCIGLNENFSHYVYKIGAGPTKDDYLVYPHLKSVEITETHELMAQEAIKWFIDLKGADNFTMNAKIEILKNGKRQGLIAWGAVKYLESLGSKVEFIAERKSQPIGEIKSKTTLTGTMFRKYADQNQWNEFTQFYFRAESGDIFSWRTGTVPCSEFSDGEVVTLFGTISKHYVNKKGDTITEINRCKIISKEEKKGA